MDYQEQMKLATVSYGNSIKLLAQQEVSKLETCVTVQKGLKGKQAVAADFVGEFPLKERTQRLSDTPLEDINRERRWYDFRQTSGAVPIDSLDELKTNYDPSDGLVQAGIAAINRNIDREIVRGYYAVNKVGEFGESTKTFDTNNIITGVSVNNDILKAIKRGNRLFEDNQVDTEKEDIFCFVNAVMSELLTDSGVYVNSDFMDGKVLAGKKLIPFNGVNFIRYNGAGLRQKLANNKIKHFAPMFCKSGVGLGKWEDIFVRISERSDKEYAKQVYLRHACGASRLEEAKCLSIEFEEN